MNWSESPAIIVTLYICTEKICLPVASILSSFLSDSFHFVQPQELQEEMKKHMGHLQQLKDYDESLAKEKEQRARLEQERIRMQVM